MNEPNLEQAGFREKQGCLPQIFSLLLIIDISRKINKDVFVGIIDYEKAFDYTNRYLLTESMINKGIGKRYLNSFINSYKKTDYVIKSSLTTIGKNISTYHGVTQGKTTSADYFSLFISDMGDYVKLGNTHDFMDPYCLLQLADDTTITADNIDSFITKVNLVSIYS